MKTLCGTDIIEIYRIKESFETLGENFKNKIENKSKNNNLSQREVERAT